MNELIELENMSFRRMILSSLIRPNKLLYRIFQPSPKMIRLGVHPPAWLGSKILSPFTSKIERTKFGKISGVTFIPKRNVKQNSLIVYLHGGGYCFGSSLTTHRIGISNLAKITGRICHSVEYRLAPEFQHPAALDDAVAAWKHIVNENLNSQIILAGDSAGGGLSLALTMYLRDNNERLPDGLILFSPWTNLNCNFETYNTRAKADPMFLPKMPREAAKNYVPESMDKSNPYISPVFGDFSGLPSTLIIVGDQEILLDDSRIVGENAAKHGVDVDVRVWPRIFHDWWLFGPLLPESKKCLLEVKEWINNHDV